MKAGTMADRADMYGTGTVKTRTHSAVKSRGRTAMEAGTAMHTGSWIAMHAANSAAMRHMNMNRHLNHSHSVEMAQSFRYKEVTEYSSHLNICAFAHRVNAYFKIGHAQNKKPARSRLG